MSGVVDLDTAAFRREVSAVLVESGELELALEVDDFSDEWVEILWDTTDGYAEDAANKVAEIDADPEWFMAQGAEG